MGTRLQYFCDVHELQDEDAIADPDLPFLGFQGKWYKFFFCKHCFFDNALSPAELMAMIEEHGVELKPEELKAQSKKKPTSGPEKNPGRSGTAGEKSELCLWCPWTGSMGGLGQHIKLHGFRGLREAYGIVCPVCQVEHKVLGIHAVKEHELHSVSELFEKARELRDPHGVVAERIAALKVDA